MKTTLSILAALLLVPLFVFGDSPVLRNDLTTNSTPIAAATVRGAINGTTGTGNAVFADKPSMTDTLTTVSSNTTVKATSLFSGSQVNTNTITTGELDSPTVKSGSQLNTNTITTSEIDATTSKFNSQLVTNTITASEIDATTAKFNNETLTNNPTWPVATANTVWAGPTTGAATAPTMRTLVAADVPTNTVIVPTQVLPQSRFRWGQWSVANATAEFSIGLGTTGNGTATFLVTSATSMAAKDNSTAGASNNTASWYTGADLVANHTLSVTINACLTNTSNVRCLIGMVNNTFNNAVASVIGSLANDFIGFSYDDQAGDTEWKLVSRDASTAVVKTSTGVAPSTTMQSFQLIGNAAGDRWDAYIDGVLVGSKTSNLPRTSVIMRMGGGVLNTANNSKTLRMFLMNVLEKYP